jgi:hypothetical protein
MSKKGFPFLFADYGFLNSFFGILSILALPIFENKSDTLLLLAAEKPEMFEFPLFKTNIFWSLLVLELS